MTYVINLGQEHRFLASQLRKLHLVYCDCDTFGHDCRILLSRNVNTLSQVLDVDNASLVKYSYIILFSIGSSTYYEIELLVKRTIYHCRALSNSGQASYHTQVKNLSQSTIMCVSVAALDTDSLYTIIYITRLQHIVI